MKKIRWSMKGKDVGNFGYMVEENSVEYKLYSILARLYMPFHVMTCSYCKRPGFWKAFNLFVLHRYPKEWKND